MRLIVYCCSDCARWPGEMSNVAKCRVLSHQKKSSSRRGREAVCVAEFARIPTLRTSEFLRIPQRRREPIGARLFAKDAKDGPSRGAEIMMNGMRRQRNRRMFTSPVVFRRFFDCPLHLEVATAVASRSTFSQNKKIGGNWLQLSSECKIRQARRGPAGATSHDRTRGAAVNDLPAIMDGTPIRPQGPPDWPLPDPDVERAVADALRD